jgi:hypothetical protein
MAEFAAAFENGQRKRMAAFLAPEARLMVHDASGTREFVGAEAASRNLEGLGARARLGDAKIQLKAGAAWVEAKLEKYDAAGAAKYGAHARAGDMAEAHASNAAAPYAAKAAHSHAAHAAQGHEAQAAAAGMIRAELEMHGEQWRVKQMHYTAE